MQNAGCIYTGAENNGGGVQRGEIPRLWVSNRVEKHPCWHTILLAKSSVLYLCSRLTSERGWLRHLLCGQIASGRHFAAAVGQTDFVTAVLPQMQEFESQNLSGRRREKRYI